MIFTCSHSCDVEDVLKAAKQLESLAQRAGQGDLHARLKFHLSVPYFGAKIPHALLFQDSAGQLRAGVFALEYRLFGWGSGIFVPLDRDGDLTVIALPEDLALAADLAAEHLTQLGARLVLLCLSRSTESVSSALKIRHRTIRRTLPLLSSVDETLAQMGARSRRNLRHAARQAIQVYGATMSRNASITEDDLLSFNRVCDYPVPDKVAQQLYQNIHLLPGCFLSGLRAQDGKWLSLLGGRQHGNISIVDWQMNRAHLGSASIGTAMRLFQIQHEVQRGATALQFTGGTPHSMHHAFVVEEITDCLWIRKPYSSPHFLAVVAHLVPSTNGLRTLLATASDRTV